MSGKYIDRVQGSVVTLKTIVNLHANDQSSDLGKAINVFKPQDVPNPFLEQSNQPQAQAQGSAGQSVEQATKK
jgi:hypothetical protein